MQRRLPLRDRLEAGLLAAWATRGPLSSALLPLAWLYGGIGALRRSLHARGWLASARLPVATVVVGNVVAGGAGKTPAVLAIVAMLARRGEKAAIVSRGHGRRDDSVRAVVPGATAGDVGDEPLLLARRSGVPVFVGRRRADAAHALLRAHPEVTVIVSDDGLQHLALQRDVEIVVVDERGFGNGRLLPAGPLREPGEAALGSSRLVLYNAEAATTSRPGYTSRRSLQGVVELGAWLRGAAPSLAALEALRGRPVFAACGIARPERFFALLRAAGIAGPTAVRPDHDPYKTLPWPPGTADAVVTEKDAVKLTPMAGSGTRIWVAALDFAPEPAFEAALLQALAAARSRPSSESP